MQIRPLVAVAEPAGTTIAATTSARAAAKEPMRVVCGMRSVSDLWLRRAPSATWQATNYDKRPSSGAGLAHRICATSDSVVVRLRLDVPLNCADGPSGRPGARRAELTAQVMTRPTQGVWTCHSWDSGQR
ncbi:hypothetical protein CTKZ_11420 [Cellulomonas algicola]|uniref:Uncharacterized protein n=1 Tax=Cellulomonas algicola TaxID=2071633 RepID=A0A401UYH6_9CELL|nr:hypothetical protein CTKZ_11420 [Cellulomonas algicola]